MNSESWIPDSGLCPDTWQWEQSIVRIRERVNFVSASKHLLPSPDILGFERAGVGYFLYKSYIGFEKTLFSRLVSTYIISLGGSPI